MADIRRHPNGQLAYLCLRDEDDNILSEHRWTERGVKTLEIIYDDDREVQNMECYPSGQPWITMLNPRDGPEEIIEWSPEGQLEYHYRDSWETQLGWERTYTKGQLVKEVVIQHSKELSTTHVRNLERSLLIKLRAALQNE